MSKRAILLTLIGALLLGVGGLAYLATTGLLPGLGDPVYTEVIPETRPKRLDRRLLTRFDGQQMSEILAVLSAEQAARASKDPPPDSPEDGNEQKLLRSLPDAPLPFPEEAEPRDEQWLRSFVTNAEKQDGTRPTEEEVWKFNLALAALRISPDQLPEILRPDATFDPELDTLSTTLVPRISSLSGAFAIGNFDSEPDLEIVDQGGVRLNKLSDTGEYVAVREAIAVFPGSGVEAADFDADGDLDLFLTRGDRFPDSLLRNEGDGAFTDVTIEVGLLAFRDSTDAAWLDYDNDGHLDLLVGSSDQPLELYHQTEAGTFQPVAWDLKLWVHRGTREIAVKDVNGDGFVDFFLGIEGYADRLCINRPGETWSEHRFPDHLGEMGLESIRNSSPTFVDFDNDGAIDLFLRSLQPPRSLTLFRNNGSTVFEDVTEAAAFPPITNATSIGTFDLDNDGYQDVFVGTRGLNTNRLLWNRGGTSFREATFAAGAAYLDSPKRIVSGDLDGDGSGDLLYQSGDGVLRLLEADGSSASWLRVRFDHARPGTRISLQARDPDWIVHSYQRVLDREETVTIGIGDSEIVERLEVFLPGEEKPTQYLEKVAPNQEVEIRLPREPKTRAVIPLGSGDSNSSATL